MIRTWNRIFALTLVAVVSLVISACGEMDPDADPRLGQGGDPQGRVLFAAQGDIHMWDGSTHRLTELGNASSPAWSVDGERYLFTRTGDAFSDLMLGNVQSGEIQSLTRNEPNATPGTQQYLSQVVWILDPSWSPSDEGFAYVSDAGTDNNFLWYQPSASDDAWRVACSQRRNDNVESPDFSPDGSQIAFAQRTSAPDDLERWMEIRICDLNSGEQTILVEGEPGDAAFFPRWSPDGEWIAYVRRLEGQTDIWVVPSDGGEPVRLTEVGDITSPEWSPDGSHIAFLDPEGASFRARYIDFSVDENGNPTASDPDDLFDADGIDAPSGLSWTE